MNGGAQVAVRVLKETNLSSDGREKKMQLCVTTPWDKGDAAPEGMEVTMTGASDAVTDEKEFGAWLFNEFLAEKLGSGEFMPSPDIEIVKGGLERYGKGVSGTKIVVPFVE